MKEDAAMQDFFSERYALLLKEWEMAGQNIGRFDTISFIIRGWAFIVATGVIAYAYTNNDTKACLFAIAPLCSLWLIDAVFKSFQRVFIFRSRKIEGYLASDQFKSDFENRTPPYFRIPDLSSGFGAGSILDRAMRVLSAALLRNVLIFHMILILLMIVSFYLLSQKP